MSLRLLACALLGAALLVGCGGSQGGGFSEGDAATVAEIRKPIQDWNRDSLAWIKEMQSNSMKPERLRALLRTMQGDVAGMEAAAARFEDPAIRVRVDRLVKAYKGELTGYSKTTAAIESGNPGAAERAFQGLQKANEVQQSAATDLMELFQSMSKATN